MSGEGESWWRTRRGKWKSSRKKLSDRFLSPSSFSCSSRSPLISTPPYFFLLSLYPLLLLLILGLLLSENFRHMSTFPWSFLLHTNMRHTFHIDELKCPVQDSVCTRIFLNGC